MAAIEQLQVKQHFDFCEALGNRRLGCIELIGGCGERTQLAYPMDGLDLLES